MDKSRFAVRAHGAALKIIDGNAVTLPTPKVFFQLFQGGLYSGLIVEQGDITYLLVASSKGSWLP